MESVTKRDFFKLFSFGATVMTRSKSKTKNKLEIYSRGIIRKSKIHESGKILFYEIHSNVIKYKEGLDVLVDVL